MKKILWIVSFTFLILTVVCSAGWSMDFVRMSNDELFELRGAIQNAPDGDKKAYSVEWEKRIASMTEEEKKKFLAPPEDDDEDLLQQPRVPAQGYEKERNQGRIIYGGPPINSDGSGK